MKFTGVGPVTTIVCVVIFIAFAASFNTQASPRSEQLIRDGLVKLKAKDVIAAARLFGQAYKADRNDGKAAFYFGVAMNRLGQHGAALTAFQRMWDLKVTHRDLGFEGGWAALARRQHRTAITLLEPYVKNNPNHGKAHEFLGRAYMGIGKLDEAEAALNKAVALNPRLAPTANYFLGNIASQRGDSAGAAQALNQIIQQAPNSPLGTIIRSRAPRQARGKPWFITGSMAGGHNSNVVGLPDGFLLPSDVSSQSSGFINLQLGGGYNWRPEQATVVTAGYDLASAFYFDIDGFDSLSHTGYVSISHRPQNNLVIGARLSGTLQTTDAELSVRQYQFAPSVSYRWDQTNFTDLSYSFADSDYVASPFTPVLDRDSTTHTFSAIHSTRIAALKTDLRFGLFHLRNDAIGNDFDYQGTGGFASARTQLPYDMEGTASISQTVNTYDNLNSLAGGTGFAFARRDRIGQLTLGLSRPLPVADNRSVSLFARYIYNDNGSNVVFFDYDQHIYAAGVRARF